MSTDLLLLHIARHVELSKEEEAFLISLLHFKKIKKKQFLFREGEVYNAAVFVTSGLLRLYAIDKNGFEHILQFAPPGWWIGDINSLLTQKPGTLNVDAIGDTEIILILKADLDRLYIEVPKLERFFRVLAEKSLATYQHRIINNLSLPAAERYNRFCELYPSLIQNLSQKYVASYIGVTPEFLSKMLGGSMPKKSD